MILRFWSVAGFLAATSFWLQMAGGQQEPSRRQLLFFEQHVRPLLAGKCLRCHGPDKQEAELRLDSRATILQGGESGPAVVPGDPDSSLLVEAIRYESLEMPPDGQLTDKQISKLVRWIQMGAPWPAGQAITRDDQAAITDEDRAYWAFQPVAVVEVPAVDDEGWCRNDIDRFIFRRLDEAGLRPAPPAKPLTLLRRLYFNLLGLPPTPEEIDRFLADRRPDAYEQLVDRLLSDPRYGEHWARHWLDLVRYGESDGYKQDAYRPDAWRYRDYVIHSLNEDKPYDQFVLEQLAGDEVAPGDPEALAATGYLRLWVYEYNQRDVRTQWENILDDVTNVTGDVFLGMGLGCARCHDHKYDPIPRRDYYRLRAFFAPLVPRDDIPLATAEQLAAYRRQLAKWEAKTAGIRQQLAAIEQPVLDQASQGAIDKFPPDIGQMIRKAPEQRSPLEEQLARMAFRQVREAHNKIKMESKLKGPDREKWKQLRQQLAQWDHLKPKPPPRVMTVTDVGPKAPETRVPGGPSVEPGFLSVLQPEPPAIQPLATSTGRRTALARWIASPDNPLSTRVIVNRIWQYHFGRGLVATSSDFGHLGQPPSHPQLLDWLTRRFLDGGWSLKKLHRLIVTSATYRQSAFHPAAKLARQKDPANRLLWRMNSRRLQAEQIRDAMLAVSGELDPARGGPSVEPSSPRRSIYIKVIRNRREPLLDAFDAPDNFTSTPQRNVTTTPNQALLLINSPWMLARARTMAGRLMQQELDGAELVQRAFRLAFGRPPTGEELQAALSFLQRQPGRIETEPASRTVAFTTGEEAAAATLPVSADPSDPGSPQPLPADQLRREVVVDFCHALFNASEFLYVD